MKKLKEEYDEHQSWGMVASIDLYHCHPPLISKPGPIRRLVVALCQHIKMKRHGPPLIERFAEGPLEGYSAMQFIETSSVTMHFDEGQNRAFIDIFSCKYFDYKKAKLFCKKFLRAKRSKAIYYFRH